MQWKLYSICKLNTIIWTCLSHFLNITYTHAAKKVKKKFINLEVILQTYANSSDVL